MKARQLLAAYLASNPQQFRCPDAPVAWCRRAGDLGTDGVNEPAAALFSVARIERHGGRPVRRPSLLPAPPNINLGERLGLKTNTDKSPCPRRALLGCYRVIMSFHVFMITGQGRAAPDALRHRLWAKLAVPVAGGQPLRSGPRRVSWQGYLPDWPRPLGRGFSWLHSPMVAVLPRPSARPPGARKSRRSARSKATP